MLFSRYQRQPGQSYDGWLEDLRGHVRNSLSEVGMGLKDLAIEADLIPMTVERFADLANPTMRPHGRTVSNIQMVFEQYGRQPKPLPVPAPAPVPVRAEESAQQRRKVVRGRRQEELPPWKKAQERRRQRRSR